MNSKAKISPAFEPFLEHSAPHDKREAIVVYRTSSPQIPRLRGRLRTLAGRLDDIAHRADIARRAAQKSTEKKIFREYQKATGASASGKRQLDVASIGESKLPVAMVEVTRQSLAALAAQPEVLAILPNQRIHLIKPKQVDYQKLVKREHQDGVTWGLKELGIPELWQTTRGADINIAVLDTGVYGEHPALRGKVKGFIVIDPLGNRINAMPTFDCGSHGTHVCGTIAGGKTDDGVSIGVAPEANLYVAAVLIGDATLLTLVEGMAWAVEQGADIINMSLGFNYYEPLFAVLFQQLIEHYGVLPVTAIGNENHGNCSSPGNAHNAFSVGAIEKMRGRAKCEVASFSSGASLVFPGDALNAFVTKPDVVAPGAQIYSCIPPDKRPDETYFYNYMDGTSMATPHVAGVAALLMAAKPDASTGDIIRALKDTAKHPSGAELRPDNRWGYGIIQPVAALNALS